MKQNSRLTVPAVASLSGLLIGAAFLYPERLPGTVLASMFLLSLSWFVPRSSKLYRDLFLTGLVLHAVGFYWLPHTISFFGGFPEFVSYLLFALFCAVSSLQLLVVAFVYRRLSEAPALFTRLAVPLAWLCGEFLVPRMFPWAVVHPFITWRSLAGLAEFTGVYPLGALLLLAAGLIVGHPRRPAGFVNRVVPAICLLAVLHGLGAIRAGIVSSELAAAPTVHAGLIQGNLEAKTKGNINYLASNLREYSSLSAAALADGAELILWPESVFNDWVPEEMTELYGTALDPDPRNKAAMIYGGLSYRLAPGTPYREFEEKAVRFNAAFAKDAEGRVQSRYYKRVLMPFGEYMPFADLVPAIKKLSPMTGEFTAGDIARPLTLTVATAEGRRELKVGALICYEDMVPSISRALAADGAQLLANLTNDAWYGDTAAPYQHHLLALWRAIETRRYLVRVTNTGYTAVVDPFGRTIEGLPLFKSVQAVKPVKLLSSRTLYSIIADLSSWALVIVAAVLMGVRWRRS